MKRVTIYKIVEEEITLYDHQNWFNMYSMQEVPKTVISVDLNNYETAMTDEIYIETVNVEKWDSCGQKYYVGVSPTLRDFLLKLREPDTFKHLNDKLDGVRASRKHAKDKLGAMLADRHEINTASTWTRIKWVFTGVKTK